MPNKEKGDKQNNCRINNAGCVTFRPNGHSPLYVNSFVTNKWLWIFLCSLQCSPMQPTIGYCAQKLSTISSPWRLYTYTHGVLHIRIIGNHTSDSAFWFCKHTVALNRWMGLKIIELLYMRVHMASTVRRVQWALLNQDQYSWNAYACIKKCFSHHPYCSWPPLVPTEPLKSSHQRASSVTQWLI